MNFVAMVGQEEACRQVEEAFVGMRNLLDRLKAVALHSSSVEMYWAVSTAAESLCLTLALMLVLQNHRETLILVGFD